MICTRLYQGLQDFNDCLQPALALQALPQYACMHGMMIYFSNKAEGLKMLKRANTFMQSLLRNKIEGVTKGFLVYLRIQGIGYRATLKDQTLQFKLGYSHDITYELPPAMRAFLPEPTLVGLYGIDKNQVRIAAPDVRCR